MAARHLMFDLYYSNALKEATYSTNVADDLVSLKPFFVNIIVDYVSFRDDSHGSIFIRTLVSTFYKQAGRKHATELSDQVYVVMIISPACYS